MAAVIGNVVGVFVVPGIMGLACGYWTSRSGWSLGWSLAACFALIVVYVGSGVQEWVISAF